MNDSAPHNERWHALCGNSTKAIFRQTRFLFSGREFSSTLRNAVLACQDLCSKGKCGDCLGSKFSLWMPTCQLRDMGRYRSDAVFADQFSRACSCALCVITGAACRWRLQKCGRCVVSAGINCTFLPTSTDLTLTACKFLLSLC